MPVKAPFFEAYLLHHRPDAARVTTALAKRASGHGKNLLVVVRFVFRRVSHDLRVRQYSNGSQGVAGIQNKQSPPAPRCTAGGPPLGKGCFILVQEEADTVSQC